MLGQLGNIVVAKAQDEVPVGKSQAGRRGRPGELQRSIKVVLPVTAERVVVEAGMSYARYVEFGTRAHTVVAKRKKALRFTNTKAGGQSRLSGSPRRGTKVTFIPRPDRARGGQQSSVRIPRIPAQPFMRPALKHVKGRAPGILREYVHARWNGAAN